MKYGIYAIRDQLTGFIAPADFMASDDMAIRSFEYSINKKDTLLYAKSTDFDLYKVGTFDTDNGQIESNIPPVLLVQGSAVKKGE